MVTNKFTPELFDTITIGDRVEAWDGVWGTVTAIEFHGRVVWNNERVIFSATIRIDSNNLRTFDRFGTPQSYSGVITREIQKYSGDLRWAYTPAPATV